MKKEAEFRSWTKIQIAKHLRSPAARIEDVVRKAHLNYDDTCKVIKGVTFDRAWTKRKRTKFGDQKAFALCRKHLIKNKKLTGRPIDISDVAWLKENPARSRTQITARHKPQRPQLPHRYAHSR
jgi:Cft2 family RNA processing exonuclease